MSFNSTFLSTLKRSGKLENFTMKDLDRWAWNLEQETEQLREMLRMAELTAGRQQASFAVKEANQRAVHALRARCGRLEKKTAEQGKEIEELKAKLNAAEMNLETSEAKVSALSQEKSELETNLRAFQDKQHYSPVRDAWGASASSAGNAKMEDGVFEHTGVYQHQPGPSTKTSWVWSCCLQADPRAPGCTRRELTQSEKFARDTRRKSKKRRPQKPLKVPVLSLHSEHLPTSPIPMSTRDKMERFLQLEDRDLSAVADQRPLTYRSYAASFAGTPKSATRRPLSSRGTVRKLGLSLD